MYIEIMVYVLGLIKNVGYNLVEFRSSFFQTGMHFISTPREICLNGKSLKTPVSNKLQFYYFPPSLHFLDIN